MCLREQERADADRIAAALKDAGWPQANRSFVVNEAICDIAETLRGKSHEEILKYFFERRARRAQRRVSPPTAA